MCAYVCVYVCVCVSVCVDECVGGLGDGCECVCVSMCVLKHVHMREQVESIHSHLAAMSCLTAESHFAAGAVRSKGAFRCR